MIRAALVSAFDWVTDHPLQVAVGLVVWVAFSVLIAVVLGPSMRSEEIEAERQQRRAVRRG